MIKTLLASVAEPVWELVTRKLPCPICGANTSCQLHADEAFVACRQVPSEWPLTTGGWLHRRDAASRSESGTYAMYDVRGARKALAACGKLDKLAMMRGEAR